MSEEYEYTDEELIIQEAITIAEAPSDIGGQSIALNGDETKESAL